MNILAFIVKEVWCIAIIILYSFIELGNQYCAGFISMNAFLFLLSSAIIDIFGAVCLLIN